MLTFEISNIKMVEYYPLITKRIHKLKTDEKGILNVELRKQYKDFLWYLIEKPNDLFQINQDYHIIFYYKKEQQKQYKFLVQFNHLQIIVILNCSMIIFRLFMIFRLDTLIFKKLEEFVKIFKLSSFYWRNLFYEIANLLAEFDGDEDKNDLEILKNHQIYQLKLLAINEETLSCEVSGTNILVTYSNLEQDTIMFYKFNLEVLFSINLLYQVKRKIFQSLHLIINLVSLQTNKMKDRKFIRKKQKFLNIFKMIISTSRLMAEIRNVSQNYYSYGLIVNIMEINRQLRVFEQMDNIYLNFIQRYMLKQNTGKANFREMVTLISESI